MNSKVFAPEKVVVNSISNIDVLNNAQEATNIQSIGTIGAIGSVKGITNDIERIAKKVLLLCNKLLLINGDSIIINIISIKLIIRIKGIIEKNKFLLFLFSSEISFDSANGRPNRLQLINKEKVGNISIYNPIPSAPINLAITIFIIIPRILVIKPPINNIIVDLIIFSFIINFMKK